MPSRNGIEWPAEHPHDKRPCVVCDVRPILLMPTRLGGVAACRRCGAPVHYRDPEDRVLPGLVSAIETKQLLEVAKAAWATRKIKIEFSPFNRPGTLPYSAEMLAADADAQADGREVGDPVVTEFERFLWKSIDDGPELSRVGADGPGVEVWVISRDGERACWLRSAPHQYAEVSREFGTLAIDPDELPEGSSVTILRATR